MKDKLTALMRKFDSPVSHLTICSLGAAVAGSAATVYYFKTRPYIFDLSKEGYKALINDEIGNFRMSNAEHSFKIIPEL
jgi:hypothetical protein